MAPKPLVPADFGIENLYDEFHGNVVIKLQNNAEMRANSMILKMNSPVFGDMFLNLQIRTVDMDDFGGEAVKVFLEALYTGEAKLNKEIFRDLDKMANVFKVSWLIEKCENYFCDLVQNDSDEYDGIRFVFEEAIYLKNAVKKPGFLEIVLEKLCIMANKDTLFVEKYMHSYLDFSKGQLDLMIQICGENSSMLLKIMKNNMEEQGRVLDENTKYLLQNINLVACMEQDRELYEALFDLLEEMENISMADLKMLMKLNRDTTKEYHAKQQSKLESRAAVPSTSGAKVVPLQDFPNLFHSREHLLCLPDLEQFCAALFISPDVKNLYMLLEVLKLGHLEFRSDWSGETGELLQKIVKIKQDRGWCAVVPEFLDSLWALHEGTIKPLLNEDHPVRKCTEVVSGTESKRIMCTKNTNSLDVVTKENTYKFFFQHPQATKCAKPTQCGFLVKVTPLIRENPGQFNMQLVTDPAMYPADIHLHGDVISAGNIHLAVEIRLSGKWYNMFISWRNKPVYVNQAVMWGEWRCRSDRTVRLVAYYDITK